jgi:hypothetical protein
MSVPRARLWYDLDSDDFECSIIRREIRMGQLTPEDATRVPPSDEIEVAILSILAKCGGELGVGYKSQVKEYAAYYFGVDPYNMTEIDSRIYDIRFETAVQQLHEFNYISIHFALARQSLQITEEGRSHLKDVLSNEFLSNEISSRLLRLPGKLQPVKEVTTTAEAARKRVQESLFNNQSIEPKRSTVPSDEISSRLLRLPDKLEPVKEVTTTAKTAI